jgi:hypothetical protein
MAENSGEEPVDIYPDGNALPPTMTEIPMSQRKCYGDDNYGNVCPVRLHCKHFLMPINTAIPGYMQMMMPGANYPSEHGCAEYWDENLGDRSKLEEIKEMAIKSGVDPTKKKTIFEVLGGKK